MVTLRRDVAAATKRRSNSSSGFYGQMTEYDRFMAQKERSESAFKVLNYDDNKSYKKAETMPHNAGDCFAMTNYADMGYNYFGQPLEQVREPKSPKEFDDYGEYLKAQLHRKAPAKLLSKEEFYALNFTESSTASQKKKRVVAASSQKGKRQKLSKNGKIFVAIYVLVVAVVASIILMVNSGTGSPITVDAGEVGRNAVEQITPLTEVAKEVGNTNWFDKLLDAISK